jgi:cytoskeletal protein CcmA (bactofilin family)
MMNPYATYAAFALVCMLLLVLPFVPAVREWLRPTDAAALPVSANYSSDIDHFARRLHADVSGRLGLGAPTGHEDFEFLPALPQAADWTQARMRLIAQHGIVSDEPISCPKPVYVQGGLRAAGGSVFPALYVTGDLELGMRSEITDWAHADGVLRLGAGSIALRRISAGESVELDRDVWFEWVHAPLIRFGSSATVLPAATAQPAPASYAELPGAIQQSPGLFLIRGDCALLPGRNYRGSLVVTGFLTVGAGTTVEGDIKARAGLSVGNGAAVHGAATCRKRIYIFRDACVWGPVISEADVLVGANARVGLPQAPTTLTARNVIVEDGVVLHGTLWAREIGMVKEA